MFIFDLWSEVKWSDTALKGYSGIVMMFSVPIQLSNNHKVVIMHEIWLVSWLEDEECDEFMKGLNTKLFLQVHV